MDIKYGAINIPSRNRQTKLPDDILTQEEIRSLISAARTDRDRAFISMLYESGCRIGELLNLHIRQVHGINMASR